MSDRQVPRFVVSLHNRAADGALCARYESYQVPARGDLVVAAGGELTAGTPFANQVVWRVDSVMWHVSSPGSRDAMRWQTQYGLARSNGCCWHAELMVWPDMGPHWAETPSWAYQRSEDEERPDAA